MIRAVSQEKQLFCICENKGADQPYSVTVQAGLCQTWTETSISAHALANSKDSHSHFHDGKE